MSYILPPVARAALSIAFVAGGGVAAGIWWGGSEHSDHDSRYTKAALGDGGDGDGGHLAPFGLPAPCAELKATRTFVAAFDRRLRIPSYAAEHLTRMEETLKRQQRRKLKQQRTPQRPAHATHIADPTTTQEDRERERGGVGGASVLGGSGGGGGGGRPRRGAFRADASTPELFRTCSNDFRGSGYDRGHIVPFADSRRTRGLLPPPPPPPPHTRPQQLPTGVTRRGQGTEPSNDAEGGGAGRGGKGEGGKDTTAERSGSLRGGDTVRPSNATVDNTTVNTTVLRAADTTLEALDDTMVMSNVAPQDPLLNRGVWARLEQWCRDLTLAGAITDVYVITGPLFVPEVDEATGALWVKYRVIGKHQVAVPTHWFKVVVAVEHGGGGHATEATLPRPGGGGDAGDAGGGEGRGGGEGEGGGVGGGVGGGERRGARIGGDESGRATAALTLAAGREGGGGGEEARAPRVMLGAFVVPNRPPASRWKGPGEYEVGVEEVERMSGLLFHPHLLHTHEHRPPPEALERERICARVDCGAAKLAWRRVVVGGGGA